MNADDGNLMPDVLQPPESEARAPRFSPATLIIGAVVLVAIGVSIWFLLKSPKEMGTVRFHQDIPVQMEPAELEYGKNMRVENLALSRAENFLHQEVTTLAGEVVNSGTQRVDGLTITIEFHDTMEQIVLRETRSLLGVKPTPLAPGERRSFEIAFDNIPPSWNMQLPTLQLARLRLANTK
jgi:hypothetical protein